jgi:hypothetical protein
VFGLDTLDILVFWKGFPTYASTQTIFTILKGHLFTFCSNSCAHGVSGDSNPIKLLTNPNLKGYRTILATNLLLGRRI